MSCIRIWMAEACLHITCPRQCLPEATTSSCKCCNVNGMWLLSIYEMIFFLQCVQIFFSLRTSSRVFFVHIYLFTVDFCLRLDKVDTCSIKVFVSALCRDHHLSTDKINNTGILLNDAPVTNSLVIMLSGADFVSDFLELAVLTKRKNYWKTPNRKTTFDLRIVAQA